MESQEIMAFRSAAKAALDANDSLMHAWRGLKANEFSALRSAEDIDLLRKLIRYRIYPANAFAVLAAISEQLATDAILDFYLGKDVHPDSRFGGLVFELSIILDDLREARGEKGLVGLLKHPRFNRGLLGDSRVIESFARALDLEFDEARAKICDISMQA